MATTPTPPVTGPAVEPPDRLQLYVRVGFGAMVVFGMVGNCAGHRTGSMISFVLISIVWCLTRIMTEAFNAYRTLSSSPPKPPSRPGPQPAVDTPAAA